jgi:O-antigen/teichoic acid export membrane protein
MMLFAQQDERIQRNQAPPVPPSVMAVGRSAMWNWASVVVAAVVSFSLTPFLVRALGNFYYGIWILATSLLAYYGLFDFGISTSVQRYVALYTSRSERAAANEILRTAVAFTGAVSAVALLGTVGVCVWCYLRLPRTPAHTALFGTVLPLLAASVALAFPAKPMGAYLRGIQRFDLCNSIAIGTTLLRAAATVVVVRLGFGIGSVALVTLVGSALSLLTHALVLWRIDASIYSAVVPRWSQVRELFQFSFFVFLTTIGDYFRFHLDTLVVARWVGVALVTPYSIAGNLVSYYSTTMAGLSGPLMTELVRRYGNPIRERDFFQRATKMTMAAALLGAIFAVANGRQLLCAWLGEPFAGVYPVLVVLSAAHAIDLGQNISMHLLYSHRRHKAMGWWTVAEGLFNLGLSIYLARRYGILGVAIGTAVPMLIVKMVLQPWYMLREAGISVRDYLWHSILPPVWVAGLTLGAALRWRWSAPRLSGVAVNVLWESAVFAILFYLLALTSEERMTARIPVMKALQRFRLRVPEEAA